MNAKQVEMIGMIVKLNEMMASLANDKPQGVEALCREIEWEAAMNKLLDVADAIKAR